MKIPARVKNLLAILGCLSVVTGCAFGNRHATLVYPPEEETKALDPKVAEASTTPAETSPAPAPAGQSITLLQFADERLDKRVVGEVQNALGMHTADVVTETDVTEWVTEALKIELEKAGYNVTKVESLSGSSQGPVVGGKIHTVYCSAYWSYDGEVAFYAWVEEDGIKIFKRRYVGRGSAGTNWTATARSYAQSLSLALADALDHLVADLSTIMREK